MLGCGGFKFSVKHVQFSVYLLCIGLLLGYQVSAVTVLVSEFPELPPLGRDKINDLDGPVSIGLVLEGWLCSMVDGPFCGKSPSQELFPLYLLLLDAYLFDGRVF